MDETGGSGAISHWLQPEVLRRVQQILPLAQDAGLSLAELALTWVLHNPNVSAAIVGGSRPEQLKQNAQASGIKLDDDLLRQIDEILDPIVERDPSRIDVFEKRP